jgi:hypothetical protein
LEPEGPPASTVSGSSNLIASGVSQTSSLSEAGWHIYAKLLPDNYQATELLFDGLVVGEQTLELPPSKPMLDYVMKDSSLGLPFHCFLSSLQQ